MVSFKFLAAAAIIFFTNPSGVLAAPHKAATPYHAASSISAQDPRHINNLTSQKVPPIDLTALKEEELVQFKVEFDGHEPTTDDTSFSQGESGLGSDIVRGSHDKRVLWPKATYPWTAVGRWVADGHVCTGVMLSELIMVTAKHCVLPFNNQNSRFEPSYLDGPRLGTANGVAHVEMTVLPVPPSGANGPQTKEEYCQVRGDWALVVLTTRIGATVGWWGLADFNPVTDVRPMIFAHMGYPGDKDHSEKPYYHGVISIKNWDKCGLFPLGTDADADRGQSGGPLWKQVSGSTQPQVLGVCSSLQGPFTFFAGGTSMTKAFEKTLKQYPNIGNTHQGKGSGSSGGAGGGSGSTGGTSGGSGGTAGPGP